MLKTKHGRDIHISTTISPIIGSSGKILGASVIARNITSRKLSEENIADKNNWSELLADIGILLNEGKTQRETLETAAGAINQKLKAKSTQIWTWNSPQGKLIPEFVVKSAEGSAQVKDRIDLGSDLIERIGRERIPCQISAVINHPDFMGQDWVKKENINHFFGIPMVVDSHLLGVLAIYLSDNGREVDFQGIQTLARIIGLNIRKNHNELQEIIFNSVPEGILVFEKSGLISQINSQVEKIFEYKREEIQGKPVEILFPGLFSFSESSGGPISKSGPNQFIRSIGLRKDGKQFPVEVMFNPVGDILGRSYILIVRDVTDLIKIEDNVRFLAAERETRITDLSVANLKLNDQMVENEMFVYSVSHDLRSPMVNLQGFSHEIESISQDLNQLLDSSDCPESIRKSGKDIISKDLSVSVGFIKTSVTRMNQIIDSLLRLSRIGKVEYRWEMVNLNELIKETIRSLRGSIEDSRTEVVIGALPFVWGDSSAIGQVFANLIENSLKYRSGKRPPKIEVYWEEKNTPGSSPLLHTIGIRDNGLGIPEASRPNVFRPMHRFHKDVARGEGIGLAVIHRVVARHFGKITFETIEEEGTTFFVSLAKGPGEFQLLGHEFVAASKKEGN